MIKTSAILFCTAFFFLPPVSGTAQGYPDTVWLPVIFYDYHADGSNPDFQPCASGLTRGMVDTVLDLDRKPIPTSIAGCSTCPSHVGAWFRVSGAGGPDTASHFMCDSNHLLRRWYWTNLTPFKGRPGEYTGLGYDSSCTLRNIVMYDSLPFISKGNGVFEYSNNSFFQLDGRGYGPGPSGSGHNNGFAMESHTVFTYKKSLIYNFGGTGDFWVYINGRLVVDFGGGHGTMDTAVNLDSVAARLGLVEGETYPLDVFYAQRMTDSSGVRISFNIVTICPCMPYLRVFPNDTIYAGDTAEIFGIVYDYSGIKIPFLSDSIRWTIDPSTYHTGDTILIPQGDTTKFTSTSRFVYRTVRIIGTSRQGTILLTDTALVFIYPPPMPPRLVIEPRGPIDLHHPNELDTLHILSSVQSASVCSVLRDKFGNFIRYGNISRWVSLDTSIVTVRKGDSLFGEGIITRSRAARDSIAKIYAIDASGFTDTIMVKLECQCAYYPLRIMTGTTVAPDTLVMDINQDTTLSVQGWRSTDSAWVDVSAIWQASPNLKIDPPAPIGNSWRFSPSDTGSGWIRVTHDYPLTSPDSIFVIFAKKTSAISGKSSLLHPDRFSTSTSGGVARIHVPLRGSHLITAYSLSGSVIRSFRTNVNDAQIRLPGGVFIVTVQTIGSLERFEAKVFSP